MASLLEKTVFYVYTLKEVGNWDIKENVWNVTKKNVHFGIPLRLGCRTMGRETHDWHVVKIKYIAHIWNNSSSMWTGVSKTEFGLQKCLRTSECRTVGQRKSNLAIHFMLTPKFSMFGGNSAEDIELSWVCWINRVSHFVHLLTETHKKIQKTPSQWMPCLPFNRSPFQPFKLDINFTKEKQHSSKSPTRHKDSKSSVAMPGRSRWGICNPSSLRLCFKR